MRNSRWWALGALNLAVLACGLDGTILSVALPTLAGALHATETDLQWFLSGYLLVLAAVVLPAGVLGDRVGRKRVMLLALTLFALGSAACAFAPSAAAFSAARLVLGLGAAGITVMALSAITVLFTPEERPRAVGIWAAANFVALPVGPILGGWLLTHYWWGWVFLINVPVALVGLGATFVLVPESRAATPPRLDGFGIASSTVGLALLTYGLISAGQRGWTDALSLLVIALGLTGLAGFVLWERRIGGEAMVDLALFQSPAFAWGVILGAVATLSLVGVLFTLPQFFQAIQGADAMGSGLRLLPLIGGLVAGAVPADRLAARIGPKITVALGFLLLAAGLLAGSRTTTTGSVGFVSAWLAVVGAGMGLALATSASAALSELTEQSSGIGSAVQQAFGKVGAPLGAAIIGSVLSTAYQAQLPLAQLPAGAVKAAEASVFAGAALAHQLGSPALLASVQGAFVHGMDAALLVSAGIAAAGMLLAALFLPARTHAWAEPITIEGELVTSR